MASSELETTESQERMTSEPPAVKQTKMRAEAFTDFLVVGAFVYLLANDKVPAEYVPWVLAALAAIGGVGGWLKSKGGGSASAAIVAAAGKPVVKVAAALLGSGARHISVGVLALLLTGCVGNVPNVEEASSKLDDLRTALVALCRASEAEACDDAVDAYNGLLASLGAEQ